MRLVLFRSLYQSVVYFSGIKSKMNPCVCYRLYGVSTPTVTREYAFSGSLCHIREFEIMDGSGYCLTIFSLSDYKHLHFSHDEYKILMRKLCVQLSTKAIAALNNSNDSRLSIEQLPFNGDWKIKFGIGNMTIGPVTAFGLLKTAPFTFDKNKNDAITANEEHFICDPKWDICACKSCPVFRRLNDFETTANCKTENIILFE